MLAEPHPQQDDRLRTLYDYEILDTPREADFDEIVDLAADICEAPISVINLIDKDRQWFKAEVGLGARETPLETSLCSHAILDNAFVEIPDTLNDPRMCDNPLCTDVDGLRFYAGALLTASNGMPIGTLCILDTKPRRLTAQQRKAVTVLARQVMTQLDLRRALRRQAVMLSEADHRVKNSLQTLGAMVRLQARQTPEAATATALEAVQRRINAVASLHGELQHSGGDDAVAAGPFLDRIASLLQEAAPTHVTLASRSDAVTLTAATASAIGTIVSEFAANSIKHAFPDAQPGRIEIDLRLKDGGYLLTCSDNGIGAKGGRKTRPGGLGQTLIAAAATQVQGHVETDLTADGCHLTLTF